MERIIDYFQFPESVKIEIPITKISLKNNENCTLSDQKLLDGLTIQSIRIKALIKQETANIAYYQTAKESYVEVYIIEVVIQSEVYTKTYQAIGHLLHKFIPHHCMIITKSDNNQSINFSLATKTISKNHSVLRVIQKEYYTNNIDFYNEKFVEALKFNNANKHDLKTFYEYYLQVFQNYNLMDVTQDFKLRNYDQTEQMLVIQDRMITYENEMNRAIKQLKSVNQMSDKVRINSDIHALKEKIQELKNTLSNYGEDQRINI